jgi:hypothetical protein
MYQAARENVERALTKGDAVWSYNTLSQDGYSPKWLIDYDAINFRIQPGFLNQSLGLTGLLYWRVDNWPGGTWDQVNNQGAFGSGNYPGEGMLLYPGAALNIAGVLPSIRLKQLRDGIEDYEYIEILKRLDRRAWALDVARTVARDWADWTHDGNVLTAAREKLGEEIDRLMSQRSPLPSTAENRR